MFQCVRVLQKGFGLGFGVQTFAALDFCWFRGLHLKRQGFGGPIRHRRKREPLQLRSVEYSL